MTPSPGIIIIIINFVGGIAIGMLQRGMEIGDAVNTYGLLTMGDGLVTQIPALLMAVSTGMIVTRSNAESDMGPTSSTQLMQSPNALMIAGVAAIAMALIPGMPPLPFILVGAGLIFASRRIAAARSAGGQDPGRRGRAPCSFPEMDPNEKLLEDMRVHPVEILLAPDLVDMVSGASDDLLARVRSLRHKIAMELGLVIPPVRTRDSVDLPPATYVDPDRRRRGRPRHRPQRPDAGPGRQPGLAPRRRDDRARVRPGREVDPRGNAPQRGDDRRHGDRPRLRPGHPPVLDRHGQRRPAAVPRGRPRADRDAWRRDELDAALTGAGRAMQTVASVLLMSDPHDIGMVAQVRSPHVERPIVYLYDSVPGGVGLAARLYDRHAELVAGALSLVSDCPCVGGCPACVGPTLGGDGSPKTGAMALLRLLADESAQKAA